MAFRENPLRRMLFTYGFVFPPISGKTPKLASLLAIQEATLRKELQIKLFSN